MKISMVLAQYSLTQISCTRQGTPKLEKIRTSQSCVTQISQVFTFKRHRLFHNQPSIHKILVETLKSKKKTTRLNKDLFFCQILSFLRKLVTKWNRKLKVLEFHN